MRWATCGVVAAALILGLTACSNEDPASPEAEARFCEARTRLDNAVDQFGQDEATPAERDEVMDAIGAVEDAATDIAESRSDEGQDPLGEYSRRLQEIPDDATPTEVAAETARASGDFIADIKNFIDPPNC